MSLFGVALKRSAAWAFAALSTLLSTVTIGVGVDWLSLQQALLLGVAGIVAGFLARFFGVLAEGLIRGTEVVAAPAQAASDKRAEIKEAATTEAKK